MIAESSRGTEARWTDGTAGCPGGAWARWEHPNQLDVASNGVARLHRSYAWGLDASGTLTGAGGVGGLVLTSHHTPQADGGTQVTTLAPLYDFNGNVLAYADVATSTITYRMEYDPFGQELSLDTLLPGEGAAEAPRFRFSTKYTDGETGLVYCGFRFYSPELGRWVNRDPIEEEGGINLYGMLGNDAVNRVDYLGNLCCEDRNAILRQKQYLYNLAQRVESQLASGAMVRPGERSCTLDHAILLGEIQNRPDMSPCWTCALESRSVYAEDQDDMHIAWPWSEAFTTPLTNGPYTNQGVVICWAALTQKAPLDLELPLFKTEIILDITGGLSTPKSFRDEYPYVY